jgi:hypothetical protein
LKASPADNKRTLACITFYLSIISLTFLLISLFIFSFKSVAPFNLIYRPL